MIISRRYEMKVKDLMSTNIICSREDSSVYSIAKEMRKANIGSLPVCDDSGNLKGIITDRDIILRFLAGMCSTDSIEDCLKSARSVTASQIMTTCPVTVSAEMNIHEAALIFSAKQIRRLPVVENSKLIGMLSLGDLAVKRVCTDEAGDALSSISCN